MKPLFLRLKAFGPFAESVDVSFERVFDGGLFLIHGRTGAGKTSLLDGLCFSLFGRPSAEEREKDLRALRSDLAAVDTMTETELIFAIGATGYRVHRIPTQVTPKKRGEGLTEHKGSAELFRLGDSVAHLREALAREGENAIAKLPWIPLAGKVEAVDDAIESLVGMNERQFRQVVILPQGRFREFLSSTSGERQAILEKLFQTDRFSRLQQYVAAQARQAEALLRESGQQLQTKLATLGLARIEDIAPRKTELEHQAEVAAGELALVRKNAESLGHDLNRAKEFELAGARERELATEAANLKQREGEIETLRQVLIRGRAWMPYFQLEDLSASLTSKRTDLDLKRQQTLMQQRDFNERRELVRKRQADIRELQPSLEDMTAERTRLREIVRPLTDIANAQKQIQSGRQQIASAGRAIEDLRAKHQDADAHAVMAMARLFALDARLHGDEAKLLETEDRRIREFELHYHHSEAARLAESLSPGAPCPVCGSKDHPNPARAFAASSRSVTHDDVARERTSFEQRRLAIAATRTKRQTRLEPLLSLRGQSREEPAATENIEGSFENEFAKYEHTAQTLRQTSQAIDIQTAELRARTEAIAQMESDTVRRLEEIPEADRNLDAVMKRGLELKTEQERREKILKESEQEGASLDASLAGLAGTLMALQDEVARLTQEQSDLASRLKGLSASIEQGLKDQQADPARPSKRLDESSLAKIGTDIENFQSAMAKNRAAREEVEHVLKRSKTERSADDLARELASMNERRTDLERRHARLAIDVENLQKFAAEAEANSKSLAQIRGEAERAVRMSHLLTGDKSQNKMLVPLSRFVLQSRFEDVLEQANRRLARMSRGQFQLRRPALSRNLRDSQGLELSVEDSVAGKERHAGSLSGGESFMAALSLALGLADVVQADLGGIKLDSVLIDEGFGTLDSEALDLAMKTLIDLQAGGRIVGIISHVQELKSQVHNRLEVSKAIRGSHVHWNVSI